MTNNFKNDLEWEYFYDDSPIEMSRMKMPKGWLIRHQYAIGGSPPKTNITYVPDEKHEWKI